MCSTVVLQPLPSFFHFKIRVAIYPRPIISFILVIRIVKINRIITIIEVIAYLIQEFEKMSLIN